MVETLWSLFWQADPSLAQKYKKHLYKTVAIHCSLPLGAIYTLFELSRTTPSCC